MGHPHGTSTAATPERYSLFGNPSSLPTTSVSASSWGSARRWPPWDVSGGAAGLSLPEGSGSGSCTWAALCRDNACRSNIDVSRNDDHILPISRDPNQWLLNNWRLILIKSENFHERAWWRTPLCWLQRAWCQLDPLLPNPDVGWPETPAATSPPGSTMSSLPARRPQSQCVLCPCQA